MIMTQKSNVVGITFRIFFKTIKTLTANQNPPNFKDLEHSKRQIITRYKHKTLTLILAESNYSKLKTLEKCWKMLIDGLETWGFISFLESRSDVTHSLQGIHWWASDVIPQWCSIPQLRWPWARHRTLNCSRAPQHEWLPIAQGVCSRCVCVHCNVCALWMG